MAYAVARGAVQGTPALRAAAKPGPDRGYGRRTLELEAPDNARFGAYSPGCVEKLFGKSEWAPLRGPMSRKKRGEKHPYRRLAPAKTHDLDPPGYLPNGFGR